MIHGLGFHNRRTKRGAAPYMLISSRLYLPVGGTSANPGLNTSQYAGGCMLQQSPPWDVVSPRLGWGGFSGVSSIGEVALGNDFLIEAAGIEISGTKYWFTFDGSNSYTTTTPSGVDGVHNATVTKGSYKWTDPNTLTIPANSWVRIIYAVNAGAAGNYLPYAGTGGPMPLAYGTTPGGRGDFFTQGSADKLSNIAGNTTAGTSGTTGSWNGAPFAFIGKRSDGGYAPAVMIAGMSIDAGANDFNAHSGAIISDGLNFGGFMRGLFRGTSRYPGLNWAIPGTKTPDLLLNQTAASGIRGWDMRDAMMAAVGYPWTTVVIGGPVNDVITGTANTTSGSPTINITAAPSSPISIGEAISGPGIPAATTIAGLGSGTGGTGTYTMSQNATATATGVAVTFPLTPALQAAATAFKARGNRRVVFATERPLSTLAEQASGTANGYLLTGGDTHQRVTGSTKQGRNIEILAKPSPIDAILDFRGATDSGVTIGAAETAKWRSDGPATTFSANAASGQKVFTCPTGFLQQGDAIALNPQLATGASERLYVDTISTAGGTDTVTTTNNLVFSYTTGQPIQVMYGDTDSVHTSRLGAVAEAVYVDAAKGTTIL